MKEELKPNYTSSIKITPKIEGSRLILEQESIFLGEVQKMEAKIIDFEDKTVRVALVKMGWTPPCANFTSHEESVCSECGGKGSSRTGGGYMGTYYKPCPTCHGTGRVTNED